MESWMGLPWALMLYTGVIALSAMVLLPSFKSKYPLFRWFGAYFLCNVLAYPVLIGLDSPVAGFLLTVLAALLLFRISSTYISQKTRLPWTSYLPGALVLLLLAASTTFLENSPLLQWFAASACTLYYTVKGWLNLLGEAKERGIQWRSPGKKLQWFRIFYALALGQQGLLLVYYFIPSPLYFLMMEVLILWFTVHEIVQSSDFFLPRTSVVKYKKSSLTPEIKIDLLMKLDILLKEKKVYKKESLTLQEVAKMVATTSHHLSQVINENKGVGFQKLLSKYRINEAKEILSQEKNNALKIEHVATDVGYNSKSAFNAAFKKHTGQTPSEFREQTVVRSYKITQLADKPEPSHYKITPPSGNVIHKKQFLTMLFNFFTVFKRILLKHKVVALINIVGITVGLSCILLMAPYVADQLGYDTELPQSEQLYRITYYDGSNFQSTTSHLLSYAVAEQFDNVTAATSISPLSGKGQLAQNHVLANSTKSIQNKESGILMVDSTFLDVFQLDVIAGDPKALYSPWNLVITETMANKYFPDTTAIGQEMLMDEMPIPIAAVVADMPRKSHFHFNALFSYVTIKTIGPDNPIFNWDSFEHYNYLKIKGDATNIKTGLKDLIYPHLKWSSEDLASLQSGNKYFDLQPISDIHLYSNAADELEENSSIHHLYMVVSILLLLLVTVGVNYINLSAAMASDRSKETGVRRTFGASPFSIFTQHYLETTLYCLLSFLLAYGLVLTLYPIFNEVMAFNYGPKDFISATVVGTGFLLVVVLSITSSAFPFIVQFNNSESIHFDLKNNTVLIYRNFLIVAQFGISILLLVGAFGIYEQINFVKNKPLGYEKNGILSFDIPKSVEFGGIEIAKLEQLHLLFKQNMPGTTTATTSSLPGGTIEYSIVSNPAKDWKQVETEHLFIDSSFLQTMNIAMVNAHRLGLQQTTNDVVYINQYLANLIGKEALHSTININFMGRDYTKTIVGVVADFHFHSLHRPIGPMVLELKPAMINKFVVRLNSSNLHDQLVLVESMYKKVYPNMDFEYTFLDQHLAYQYASEQRTFKILTILSIVTLLLSSLGLFANAMSILREKTKELGVRKILGASQWSIIQLVLFRFLKLIGLSLLLFLPLGYWLTKDWLSYYSYQAPLSITTYLLAALIVVLVALLSIAHVVVKSGRSNPIQALKSE